MSRSPLEILHPDGFVRRAELFGDGDAGVLAPAASRGGDDAPALALLVPTRSQGRDQAWVDQAARVAAGVAGDGLVVAIRPSRRLRARLAEAGLRAQGRMLHLPDVERSRWIVPAAAPLVRHATRRLLQPRGPKRLAGEALAVRAVAPLTPSSVVFRRPEGRPLLEWLDRLDPRGPRGPAIVGSSWRAEGATVIQRFGAGSAPQVVAKVGGGAASEARALTDVAAGAALGPVTVPALVAGGELAGAPVVVETPVPGAPAVGALRGSRGRAARLMGAVAAWLADWNSATAARRPFTASDAERHVLGPARDMAPMLSGADGYLARLERLCAECVGAQLPFVAAHNDLTAANLMLAPGRRIGVVDWEQAALGCPPLGDLAYAIADFAAATRSYRDRPAAFDDCFAPGGRFSSLAEELLDRACRALALSMPQRRLCLQACWLRHADNEAREEAVAPGGEEEPPFRAILARVAQALPEASSV